MLYLYIPFKREWRKRGFPVFQSNSTFKNRSDSNAFFSTWRIKKSWSISIIHFLWVWLRDKQRCAYVWCDSDSSPVYVTAVADKIAWSLSFSLLIEGNSYSLYDRILDRERRGKMNNVYTQPPPTLFTIDHTVNVDCNLLACFETAALAVLTLMV